MKFTFSFTKRLIFALCFLFLIGNFTILDVYAYSTADNLQDGGVYFIKNKNSGKYLDVQGAIDEDGANVAQYDFNGGDNQKWQVDYQGSGLYRLVSLCGSGNRVLDVNPGDNTQGGNIDIWSDLGIDDMRFAIVLNSDGYSYRIISQCSSYSKVVTVQNASNDEGASVFQYTYNASTNDEWLFEPTFKDQDLGSQYAHMVFNTTCPTYPNLRTMGGANAGDCANFTSQCLLQAGSAHFNNTWWIYKKNGSYPSPTTTTQLDNSWSLADPSPWISAVEFNDFWSSYADTTSEYTAQYILSNPDSIYNSIYERGDAVQILQKVNWWYEGYHTMYLCNYGTYDGNYNFTLSYHSINMIDKGLLEICQAYNTSNYKFKFFHFQ